MEYCLVPLRSCFGIPNAIMRATGGGTGGWPLSAASRHGHGGRSGTASAGGRYASAVKDPHNVPVTLDTLNMGNDVVIVKNGHRICGSGGALSNVPILQSKAYFEVKIQQTGVWGLGLALPDVNLNQVPMGHDRFSWILTSDGTLRHDGVTLHTIIPESARPVEGDIVGVSFDHVQLTFYINGTKLDYSVGGVRGGSEFFPVVYVDDGAILDTEFMGPFQHDPPDGFDRIMVEKSLL